MHCELSISVGDTLESVVGNVELGFNLGLGLRLQLGLTLV